MASIVSVIALFIVCGASSSLYELDVSFKPQWPQGAHMFSGVGVATSVFPSGESLVFVTQRGNASIDPVLVMNPQTGALVDSWGKKHVALDRSKTPAAPTWGAHGIAVENCKSSCTAEGPTRIWIDDFTNFTLTAFTASGAKVLQLGTPGVPGNGTNPLQFGNVADSAIATAENSAPTWVYSSDGDGGYANRVVAFSLDGDVPTVQWSTGHIYNNPHSVARHSRTGMLIIADREQNETRLLDGQTGEDLGSWDCGLGLGAGGKPFGVRTLMMAGRDLVFVAIMDNPQDGRNQKIAVLDGSKLTRSLGASSKCQILQMIHVDTAYSGPHLLGVDHSTGDLYAALVADAPRSTVLRFRCVGC